MKEKSSLARHWQERPALFLLPFILLAICWPFIDRPTGDPVKVTGMVTSVTPLPGDRGRRVGGSSYIAVVDGNRTVEFTYVGQLTVGSKVILYRTQRRVSGGYVYSPYL